MAKFRCKRSGNIVEFKGEIDIESMRKAEGYEEVIDSYEEVVDPIVADNVVEATIIMADEPQAIEVIDEKPKRKGRPRKTV